MKKTSLLLAVVALAAAGAAAWWLQNRPAAAPGAAAPVAAAPAAGGRPSAGGPPGAGAPGPAAVEVARVQRAAVVEDAQAVGTLQSRQGVVLRPEVAGRIVRLGFADGEAVRRGQVLVQMDDTLQRAQLQQAQAQAAIARTNLQRQRELQAQGFVSPSAVDQSAAALEVAEAQVALAQAQLARLRIVAPFDGRVGIRQVDIGDYVKDGADIVSLEDAARMEVAFQLPERVLPQLRVGQSVEVLLDAMPGRRFEGRIQALDAALQADGRAIRVKASVDNTDGTLRAGQFARVRAVFATRADALVVPEEALVPQGGRQWVVTLVDSPAGPATRRVEVTLGSRQPGRVEVVRGLAEGDTVVVAGQAMLMRVDGLPVRVLGTPPAAPGAPAPAASTARPPQP